MKFNTSVIELIKKRSSWRTYNGLEIEDDKKAKLSNFISSLDDASFGTTVRIHLIDAELLKKGKVPGTYGFIKGAKSFLVGEVKRGKMNLEDFGYLFELAILYATELGLGTCWMAGTFNRTSFAEKINLTDDFFLPAISPVGYSLDKRHSVDTVTRFIAGSKRRKPWRDLFFNADFNTPLDNSEAGDYSTPIEMVRIAPSASNRQPWRIIKDRDNFHFFLHHNSGYDKMLKGSDIQRLDMGIAMCHFEQTAIELGLQGKWEIRDDNFDPLPGRTEYIVSWIM